MSMTQRFFSGLAITSLLVSASAQADRGTPWSSRQSEASEQFRFSGLDSKVLRVPHPAEWRAGRLVLVSHADRERFAKDSEHAAETLRSDPSFLARFGRIVPKIHVEHGSWMEHSERSGRSFTELSDKSKGEAREEMAKALEMASRLVGSVDPDPSRFVFEYSGGKIKGWYASPPPPHGVTTGYNFKRVLGEGANARAYEVESFSENTKHLRVVKVLKPFAPRRTPVEAPVATLDSLSKEAEFLSHRLAHDPGFVARFGDIIPETRALAPGVIAQEMATGEPFDALSSKAQEHARDEIKDLRAMVKVLAPGVMVTGRTKNYLFTSEGRIASLYDIASDGHRAYEKAGLTDRIYAHKQQPGPEFRSDARNEAHSEVRNAD